MTPTLNKKIAFAHFEKKRHKKSADFREYQTKTRVFGRSEKI